MTDIFADYTFRLVASGSALLGILSGILGSFSVLRKQSLIGDAISHCALPGICLAFLATRIKSTPMLLFGALIAGILGALLIFIIVRYSKIKFDNALAFTLSFFFGIGMVLLTYIQKIPNANQAGLEKFIFGQASTMLREDINIITGIGILVFLLIILLWKEFKLISFDPDFAHSLGYPVRMLSFLLLSMTVIGIIAGLQMVGVVLMSAMLIAPAAAARQWTDRLETMVFLSSVFGGLSGIIGTTVSSMYDKVPTGPSIVITISLIVVFSILFSPRRGLLFAMFQKNKNKQAILALLNGERRGDIR